MSGRAALRRDRHARDEAAAADRHDRAPRDRDGAASISSATVPWPAITAGSSNAGTIVAPVRAAIAPASAVASVRVAPWSTTCAPSVSVRVILVNGVTLGHHDRRVDAEQPRVVGDALRVVAGRGRDHALGPLRARRAPSRKLRAPRSLNDAVYCRFSNFSTISAPVISESVREVGARRLDDRVRGSAPPPRRRRRRSRAASLSRIISPRRMVAGIRCAPVRAA